jgi:hypothetical protein
MKKQGYPSVDPDLPPTPFWIDALWMIKFAVVNPTFGDLEGVSFSLFSCRKRLVYF